MGNKKDIYELTDEVLERSLKRALELNIKDFVIASCSGKTVEIFLSKIEYYKSSNLMQNNASITNRSAPDLNIVCVTHQVGFLEPNQNEMATQARELLISRGVKILTATHLLGGVDRALRIQFKGVYPAEIVSSSLRMLGQGIKVCTEISVMAADAGLITAYCDVMAIAGTGAGADTAAIICPAHSQLFFETKIREIIAKPSEF